MSALIWLAIVAVWGFVLIPMWLRHHDSVVEQRSADRFSTAMRVLSRRGSQRGGSGPLPGAPPEGPVTGAQEATGMAHSRTGEPADGDPGADAGSAEESGRAISGAAGSPATPGGSADRLSGDRLSGPPAGGPRQRPMAPSAVPLGPGLPGARPGAPGGYLTGDRAVRAVQADHAALIRLRRQRLLVLLVALPVSIVLAATLGGMWIIVQLIVDAGTAGYVLHLRRSAQAHRRLVRSRAALDRRIAAERAARARGGFRGWDGTASAPGARAARGGDYTPVRLSGDNADEHLTADELAHARAETMDLRGSVDHSDEAGTAYRAGAADEGDDADGDVLDDHLLDDHLLDDDLLDDEHYDDVLAEDVGHDVAGYTDDHLDGDDAGAEGEAGARGAVMPPPAVGGPYTGEIITRTAYADYGAAVHGDHLGPVEYVEYVRADQGEPMDRPSHPAAHADQPAYYEYAAHPAQPGQAGPAGQGYDAEPRHAYAEHVDHGHGYDQRYEVAYEQTYEAGHQPAVDPAAAGTAVGGGDAAELPGVAPAVTPAPAPAPATPGYRAARPVPRPGARPNTSRPGRVQVHPPGSHGGLIPPAATAGEAATGTPAAPAAQAGQDPDELETLLRRHAVGS